MLETVRSFVPLRIKQKLVVDLNQQLRDGTCMIAARHLLSSLSYYYRTPYSGPRRRLRI